MSFVVDGCQAHSVIMATSTCRLLLLFVFFATADAAAIGTQPAIEVSNTKLRLTPRASTCPQVGNADLYGLGIRLGVYLQLFSTLIANRFLPDTAQAAWDANAVFLVAIFIATIKSSVGSSHIAAFEAFVMLQMLLAFVLAVFTVTHRQWNWFMEFHGQTIGRDFSAGPGSQLGHFARATLTAAIACYQVWYWFVGIDRLDQRSHCTAFVFLFTRISIRSRAVIVFKIGSILYLIIKALRLFVESPIGRVTYDFLPLSRQEEDYCEVGRFNLKRSLLKWYGGYGPSKSDSDDSTKQVNQIDRRARNIEYTAERIAAIWHTISLSCNLAVILWSIVAIETTLVWNGVTQIYSISSTGQLIPLVVAIAGTGQNAVHLLARWRSRVSTPRTLAIAQMQIQLVANRVQSEKCPRPDITLDVESGQWRYRLFRGKAVIFAAHRPKRRWSLDASGCDDIVLPSKPHYFSSYHALAPTLPVLEADQDLRTHLLFYHKPIKPIWNTARFLYNSKNGGSHVFHQRRVLTRRLSLDEVQAKSIWPRPHLARSLADIPLRTANATRHTEKERVKWYGEELRRLRKQWRGQHPDHQLRSRPRNRFETGPWVKPVDIQEGSMFSSSTQGLYDNPRSRSASRRRYSADDQSWAYRWRRDRPLPFLERSSSPSASYYSYDNSISSRRRSRRSMSPQRSKFTTKIARFFRIVTAALVNLFCFCAPCAIGRDYAARRKRRRQFGTLQTIDDDPNAMQRARAGMPARPMRCTECDKDLLSRSTTRQVRRLVPEAYDSSSTSTYFSVARLERLIRFARSRLLFALVRSHAVLLGIPWEPPLINQEF